MFFFRGKPGAPFAVIAPGGGFSYVGSVHEGFPYAVEISSKGYNAFVLKYRAGQGGAVATQDLAAAISYIFENADTLGVGTQGLFPVGQFRGSENGCVDRLARRRPLRREGLAEAGCCRDGLHGPFGPFDPMTLRPSWLSASTTGSPLPPRWNGGLRRCDEAGTEVEYRKYKNLGHGFGLGTGTSAEGWIANALQFWTKFTRN